MNLNLFRPHQHVFGKVGHALIVVLSQAIRLQPILLTLGFMVDATPLRDLRLLVLLLEHVRVKHLDIIFYFSK